MCLLCTEQITSGTCPVCRAIFATRSFGLNIALHDMMLRFMPSYEQRAQRAQLQRSVQQMMTEYFRSKRFDYIQRVIGKKIRVTDLQEKCATLMPGLTDTEIHLMVHKRFYIVEFSGVQWILTNHRTILTEFCSELHGKYDLICGHLAATSMPELVKMGVTPVDYKIECPSDEDLFAMFQNITNSAPDSSTRIIPKRGRQRRPIT